MSEDKKIEEGIRKYQSFLVTEYGYVDLILISFFNYEQDNNKDK